MKRVFLVLLMILMNLYACATTQQYQGNNLPSLDSSAFPNFSFLEKIPDGLTPKIGEGKGETKITMDMVVSDGKEDFISRSEIIWKWNIDVENNLIYNDHIMDMVIKSNNEKQKTKIEFEAINDMDGKQIKFEVSDIYKNAELPAEEIDGLKKILSNRIRAQFSNLGKLIKSGDVLQSYSMKDLLGWGNLVLEDKSQGKAHEIVKGLGVFKNKPVVVTETVYDGKISDPRFICDVRLKGYSLYDPSTFIVIYGKSAGFVSLFLPQKGNYQIKMNVEFEAIDIQIRNVIEKRI